MRILIDSLVAVMLAAVLAGIIFIDRRQDEDNLAVEKTRDAVRAIEQQLTLQTALGEVELTDQGFPRTVEASWFKVRVPRNDLASPQTPWMEIASGRDRELTHPATRTLRDDSIASFWYNPYQGIVRARVPDGLSNERTLEIYNSVNSTEIASLFDPMRN